MYAMDSICIYEYITSIPTESFPQQAPFFSSQRIYIRNSENS